MRVSHTAEPFSLHGNALPAGFNGNDIEELYRRRYVKPKDSYEKSSEYEIRARRSILQPERFAFVLEQGLLGPTVEYNADAEEFFVSIFTSPLIEGYGAKFDKTRSIFIVRTKQVRHREYVAHNGFGSEVHVSESKSRTYALSVARPPLTQVALRFKAVPAKARKIGASLSVLVVCRLGQVLNGDRSLENANGFEKTDATFDRPFDSTDYYYVIPSFVEEVWVFDRVSGEVLARNEGLVTRDRIISIQSSGEKVKGTWGGGHVVERAEFGVEFVEMFVPTDDGHTPEKGDSVTLQYTALLPSGEESGIAEEANQTLEFRYEELEAFREWGAAIRGMKIGGARRVKIPPDLRNEPAESQRPPQSSSQIFEVKLIGITH